ncbi:MAG: hypothetical protein IAF08_10490, partial [Rhizobacter sp.]|nr:hypothetical protein [Chlorobiales bacterium]
MYHLRQRRFVSDLGTLTYPLNYPAVRYLTYESANQIWLTVSTDNGNSWSNDTLIGNGKHPSLAASNGSAMVVWLNLDGTYPRIHSRFATPQTAPSTIPAVYLNAVEVVPVGLGYQPTNTAHPVVCYLGSSRGYITVYEATPDGIVGGTSDNPFLVASRYSYVPGVKSGNAYAWQNPVQVPQSGVQGSNVSLHPSADYSWTPSSEGNGEMKLVWQRYVEGNPPVTPIGTAANLLAPLQYIGLSASTESISDVEFWPIAPVSIQPDGRTKRYYRPCIVTDPTNSEKIIAWHALDSASNSAVVMVKSIPANNSTTSPPSAFGQYSNWFSPSLTFATDGSVSLWMERGSLAVMQV